MTSAAHDLDPGHVPTHVALGRIEAEIAETAAVLRDLQEALSPLSATLGTALMVRMQSLDLAEQTLRDLAGAVGAVGASAAGQAPIDLNEVAAGCKLADIACRLRGETAVPALAEIDFF